MAKIKKEEKQDKIKREEIRGRHNEYFIPPDIKGKDGEKGKKEKKKGE